MPQFSNDDRNMLDAETRLWCVVSLLDDIDPGAWELLVKALRETALSIAKELRKYNDQFEKEEVD